MVFALRTSRRRIFLNLVSRLGLRVVDVAPGTVVVSRRAGVRLRPLDPYAVLVMRRGRERREWRWFEWEKALVSYALNEHVFEMLRKYSVNCVIDVGANRGQYGQRLRCSGYRGHIISFEPVPALFEQLRRQAADDPCWLVYPYALGAANTLVSMHVVPGTLSSLRAPSTFGARRYRELRKPVTEQIEMRRLDGLLDDLLAHVEAPRPYLKLDTQGYDVEVFEGLGERVSDFVGMQSEVALIRVYDGMPRMPEALATYEAAGFEITALYPVSRERATARIIEFDCVMMRPDADAA